ncbi:MAG: type IV pilus biogenesis/stability protein PilW [Rhodanobacteraceae bacterium]|nr:MAG: type IV pilus biogenesis/stability protein PilW [Rhodanobacteraceae bacterium]
MRHKTYCVLAVMGLAFALAACKQTPGIIKYPTPMSNLKTAPHDTTQEDKQAAAQTHTQLAAAYMGQDHLKEAEDALHKALGFDDKYIPAHTMLAILDWRINRLQDADNEFRKAVALDPSNGDTNNNYGRFLCEQGKRQEAMQHFQRALTDPFYKTPAVANANAGMCLLRFKDYAGAASYLHKALEAQPDYGPALLAMAQSDLDQDKAFAARGYMQRFESSGQATPQSLLLGYRIATRLGDKETATNYSNRLQDQFPNSTQAQSLNGPNHD